MRFTPIPTHIASLHAAFAIPQDYASQRSLVVQPEADEKDLVLAAFTTGRGEPVGLFRPTAAAWDRMSRRALEEGATLHAISGFRSVARQAEIVRTKLARGDSINAILQIVAAPGFSEHHTGRAIDIGTPGDPPLEESFERTHAFAWLIQNAFEFGFTLSYPRQNHHGIVYEPWHWLWQP